MIRISFLSGRWSGFLTITPMEKFNYSNKTGFSVKPATTQSQDEKIKLHEDRLKQSVEKPVGSENLVVNNTKYIM